MTLSSESVIPHSLKENYESRTIGGGSSFYSRFTAVLGFGSTIREISETAGLKSGSTVCKYLSRMTKRGLVASEPGQPRSPHVLEPRL